MKILVAHKTNIISGNPVETYSRSMVRTLRELGHEVIETAKVPLKNPEAYKNFDLLLDVDCGRDEKGELHWHGEKEKPPHIKSAVYFIDSHGYPGFHRRLAPHYDHVFFAVWDKRDLFTKHPSAHWSPNFTDLKWFDGDKYSKKEAALDFGFFGSKHGLSRAIPLIRIANDNQWTHDVRQISADGKHRWPETGRAMSRCKILFNHGQKHDGPNLRVMESMAMLRPLITDWEARSGMDKLFKPWTHYVPYESYSYKGLGQAMDWLMSFPNEREKIAEQAYGEVTSKHLVQHRIDQILEVVCSGIV
jgi:hypothetical protein